MAESKPKRGRPRKAEADRMSASLFFEYIPPEGRKKLSPAQVREHLASFWEQSASMSDVRERLEEEGGVGLVLDESAHTLAQYDREAWQGRKSGMFLAMTQAERERIDFFCRTVLVERRGLPTPIGVGSLMRRVVAGAPIALDDCETLYDDWQSKTKKIGQEGVVIFDLYERGGPAFAEEQAVLAAQRRRDRGEEDVQIPRRTIKKYPDGVKFVFEFLEKSASSTDILAALSAAGGGEPVAVGLVWMRSRRPVQTRDRWSEEDWRKNRRTYKIALGYEGKRELISLAAVTNMSLGAIIRRAIAGEYIVLSDVEAPDAP